MTGFWAVPKSARAGGPDQNAASAEDDAAGAEAQSEPEHAPLTGANADEGDVAVLDAPVVNDSDGAVAAEPRGEVIEANAVTIEANPNTEVAAPVGAGEPVADEAESTDAQPPVAEVTEEPAPPADNGTTVDYDQLEEQRPTPPVAPEHPFTLAIDIGGTALKASVLDTTGRMAADRMRVDTTYPMRPDALVDALVALVAPLPSAERVSVGFPGVVRNGLVITAPHFVTTKGPGSKVSPVLVEAWKRFPLEETLHLRMNRPVRLLNDADLQGLAVISGIGIELVVTLGTGVGTALFEDGCLAPHLELAHHPLHNDKTYNDELGVNALEEVGTKTWRKRVVRMLDVLDGLVNYDHCYVGGGNARKLIGHVGDRVQIVDNIAGILGGIKLWENTDEAVPPHS